MRFEQIKAVAKDQNFFLNVHQSQQIGTLLKAHMCALAADIRAVSKAPQDRLKYMQSHGTQGTWHGKKQLGGLKSMCQSIPKEADWAILATTLSFTLHFDESSRLRLIAVQTVAQWRNAVIRNPAATPDPDDFGIVKEELKSLGAKSSTKAGLDQSTGGGRRRESCRAHAITHNNSTAATNPPKHHLQLPTAKHHP